MRRAAILAIVVAVLVVPAAQGQEARPGGAGPDLAARARVLELADARRFDGAGLTALATSADIGVRVAVARAVGELAREDGVAILATLAGDCSAAVRAAALEGAGRLAATPGLEAGAKARLAALVERGLGDGGGVVRRAAAWAAGAGAFDGAGSWLLRRLGSERDAAVRAAILAELWRSEAEGWQAAAEEALGALDPGERFAAAVSLGRGGEKGADAALLAHAADDDPLVRAAVLEAGRRLDAAAFSATFSAALGDADRRVRIAALAGLAATGGGAPPSPATAARLAAALGDASFAAAQERVAAIRAAGALGCCADLLAPIAAGPEPWVGGESLIALARERDPRAEKLVGSWLASEDGARRVDAVRTARWLAAPAALLARAVADSAPAVRLAAVEASVALGAGERVGLLRPLLDDADPAVRAACVTALGEADALPPAATLVAMLGRERGQTLPDAAVALVEALAAGRQLSGEVRSALDSLAGGADPVVARAAWDALRRHGSHRPLPEVATGKSAAFYREVAEWAAGPHWLEVVTWRGTMQIALDGEDAPLTGYRLSRLADEKFFDATTFHRVVPDFVVQGGDPRGDGWGGPGFALRDELSLVPYDAGAVGMALAGPDSGGSQLFVTLLPQPHLVGRYPCVGRVVRGLDVAGRLRVGDRILRVRAGEGPPPAAFPVLYGVLDPGRLDAEIAGWREERQGYAPRQAALDLLASAKLRYDLTVAMGTWCSDSQEQIPRLQEVLAALGERSPFERLTLIGVDRSKETLPSQWAYGPVDLVPTIVVSSGGAEIGRIVETPSSGSIEQDLVRILAPVEGFPADNEGGR